MTIEDRLWRRVEKTAACWLWRGCVDKDGYGKIVRWANGPKTSVHRLSWTIHNGPITPNQYVCHRCDVPNCVNPEHLYIGTPADNMRDKVARGRQTRGEAQWEAKLDSVKVFEIIDLSKDGISHRKIAKAYGVDPTSIANVVSGKKWSHVTGIRRGV